MNITASFHATSPATHMRTAAGARPFTEDDLAGIPWEALATTKVFDVVAPINWSGFYVTVQFTDGAGNLSPAYTDDISVEGMPAAYPFSTP